MDGKRTIAGREREFHTYFGARRVVHRDQRRRHRLPAAAGGSIAFVPEHVVPVCARCARNGAITSMASTASSTR
jgi:hypothetical protein